MKLPDNAKRVFKGVIFEIYQWEQKMYDGSTTIFESIKRPGTILVLPTQDNKILISEEEQPGKPPFVTLLGGRQEENEDPLEGAKRELLEEAGLTSDDWELYKIYEPLTKFDWQVYLYIARNCQKVAEPNLDGGEKIQVKAVTFEQFLEQIQQDDFWGGEISLDILKMILKPEKLAEFKQKLFSPPS